ncbi:hypothetical protein HGRIS_002487 [Hohenbuehelia grisea]|uniref:Uncharacterized protein n=1 Tax=Hohenbuehelia grisea TaxID=104357 RepID=A0ABR3JLR9_9AGAR
MAFPTPVGGASLPADFAPSVLFAILYGCLLPVMFWRAFQRRSWNLVVIGCIGFSIERVVVFALRASMANNDRRRHLAGLLTYTQVTFANGFLTIVQDLFKLVRCIMVNASYGTNTAFQAPAVAGARRAASRPIAPPASKSARLFGTSPATYEEIIEMNPISEVIKEGAPYIEDHPRRRFWARRFGDAGALLFFAALIPGIVAHAHFGKDLRAGRNADKVMTLRYLSTAVALALVIVVIATVVWANMFMDRVSRPATRLILAISLCMLTVCTYRLSVMFNRSDSLVSTAPDALNSKSDKALFYLFHIAPEWLAIGLLFGYNVREICGTGPFGDWRHRDENEEERAKREQKEAARAEADVANAA